MSVRRAARLGTLLAMAVLLPIASACSSDDDPTAPGADPLVGTWQVTSFQALGSDLIAQGMTLTITLSAAKTYTIVVTDDLLGTCDQGTTCTETGSYSSTSTQITIDPGLEDEVTFNYSIQGNSMTFTGSIDGNPVTVVLQKA